MSVGQGRDRKKSVCVCVSVSRWVPACDARNGGETAWLQFPAKAGKQLLEGGGKRGIERGRERRGGLSMEHAQSLSQAVQNHPLSQTVEINANTHSSPIFAEKLLLFTLPGWRFKSVRSSTLEILLCCIQIKPVNTSPKPHKGVCGPGGLDLYFQVWLQSKLTVEG